MFGLCPEIDLQSLSAFAFRKACTKKYYDGIDYLKQLGALNTINEICKFDFYLESCSLETIKYLYALDIGFIIDSRSAFVHSCKKNNFEMIKWLSSVQIDITPYVDECFFETVKSNGKISVLKWLLALGVKIDNETVNNCFLHSCHKNSMEIVNLLLTLNVKIDNKKLTNCLIHSCKVNNANIIKKLLALDIILSSNEFNNCISNLCEKESILLSDILSKFNLEINKETLDVLYEKIKTTHNPKFFRDVFEILKKYNCAINYSDFINKTVCVIYGKHIYTYCLYPFKTCCEKGDIENATWFCDILDRYSYMEPLFLVTICRYKQIKFAEWYLEKLKNVINFDTMLSGFHEALMNYSSELAKLIFEYEPHVFLNRNKYSDFGYYLRNALLNHLTDKLIPNASSRYILLKMKCDGYMTQTDFENVTVVEDYVFYFLCKYNRIDILTKLGEKYTHLYFEVDNGKITRYEIRRPLVKRAV